jgi:hypothetical protein
MHQTPWTNKASSVPSDRIRPNHSANTKAKGKGKGRQEEPLKSKEVRNLESLLTALQESNENSKRIEMDPKGGCFCLGMHFHPLKSISAPDFIDSANAQSFALCPIVYLLRLYSLHHQPSQLRLRLLFFATPNTIC